MSDEFEDDDPTADPYAFIANVQSYTASVPCGIGKCTQSFSGEGKTEAIAKMLATRDANEHRRDDH